jgi:inorganic triphosphatase YgiF
MKPTDSDVPHQGGDHHKEREWQFEADDLEAVHAWLMTQPFGPAITVVAGSESVLEDTYLDTADWCIFQAGYALRIRRQGQRTEATVKSLKGGDQALRTREEITEQLPDDSSGFPAGSSGPVGRLIGTQAGQQPLQSFLELKTRRQVFNLVSGDVLLAEIALDSTSIFGAQDRARPLLFRVEVELREAEAEELQPVVDSLSRSCDIRPTMTSKLEAGLAALGISPPD